MCAQFGLHFVNLVDFPIGAVAVRAGAFMASADTFQITLKGAGGHGGMPHTTADTIVAAAYLITQVQSIVSRNIHPIDSGVVSIGTIHGGYNDNIIADCVKLTGTIRAYNENTRFVLRFGAVWCGCVVLCSDSVLLSLQQTADHAPSARYGGRLRQNVYRLSPHQH